MRWFFVRGFVVVCTFVHRFDSTGNMEHWGSQNSRLIAEPSWDSSIRLGFTGEVDSAEYLSGPAGTVTVHNCRCVHGSAPNLSSRSRPLFLCAYSAAHALPITDLTRGGKYSETIVRGKAARWAKFDSRPVLLPPDWSKTRHKSIFEHQQNEN